MTARNNDVRLAVIGLGYVGLPLAVEFGKKRPVVGFDIDEFRIKDLAAGRDHTLEVSAAGFAAAVPGVRIAPYSSVRNRVDSMRSRGTVCGSW